MTPFSAWNHPREMPPAGTPRPLPAAVAVRPEAT